MPLTPDEMREVVAGLTCWWELGSFATDVHVLRGRVQAHLDGTAPPPDDEPPLDEFPADLRAKIEVLAAEGPTPEIQQAAREFLTDVEREE